MNVRRSRRRWWPNWLIDRQPLSFAVTTLVLGLAAAVSSPRAATPSAPNNTVATPGAFQSVRPYWVELTLAQRSALQPLADDWERLDVQTKKKWVEIANRYPRMQPDEQARTQQRMREWAGLTPEQRRTARDSFARVRAMNPDQRADMLRKYQELPPEKRQALTHEGQATRLIVVPKPLGSPMPVSRRAELSEGARVPNPAIAAQKSANPIVAPARKPRTAVPTPAPPPVIATPADAAVPPTTPPAGPAPGSVPTPPNAVP